jgi:hypothetical protein
LENLLEELTEDVRYVFSEETALQCGGLRRSPLTEANHLSSGLIHE